MKREVVYDVKPDDQSSEYTILEVDVLDGNREYINSIRIIVLGRITSVALATE